MGATRPSSALLSFRIHPCRERIYPFRLLRFLSEPSGRDDAINVSVHCKCASEKSYRQLFTINYSSFIIHWGGHRPSLFCLPLAELEGKVSPLVTDEVLLNHCRQANTFYLLTIEILRPELEKIVPEMSFLFRHIPSQLLRKRR